MDRFEYIILYRSKTGWHETEWKDTNGVEHKVLDARFNEDMVKILNEYGEQGWELVAAQGLPGTQLTLKRRRQDGG